MTEREQRIAETVANVVRPIVQPQVRDPATCVLSTRIAMEVLSYFAIEAQPQPCQLYAINEAMARWLESGQAGGQEAAREAGAWGVQTHGPMSDDEKKWDGHLVALLPDALLDADLGAFNRPARGIDLPDGFLGSTADTVAPWAYVIGGATVIYTPTDDDRWKESVDWRSKKYKAYAGPIIRAVKRRLSV